MSSHIASDTSETSDLPATPAAPATTVPTSQRKSTFASRLNDNLPTLEKLAHHYPGLFGETFLPLQRGIFQELLSAHPDAFTSDTLKAALSAHTRSTRYLNAIANGLPRHNLHGEVTEPMATEHIYQALLEVFKRRKAKPGEDLQAKLCQRIASAYVASGLTRDTYTALVQSKNEAANLALLNAMALAAEHDAKDEATRRAFIASGQTVAAFADMYGLQPLKVEESLARASRFSDSGPSSIS
jgi:ProP effector